MIKKVAILNGRIEHVYHNETDETFIEGATFERREMEYTDEHGWREVGFIPAPTDKERIEQLENMILMMMEGI